MKVKSLKRLVAGFLATLTLFSSIPVDAYDADIPSVLNTGDDTVYSIPVTVNYYLDNSQLTNSDSFTVSMTTSQVKTIGDELENLSLGSFTISETVKNELMSTSGINDLDKFTQGYHSAFTSGLVQAESADITVDNYVINTAKFKSLETGTGTYPTNYKKIKFIENLASKGITYNIYFNSVTGGKGTLNVTYETTDGVNLGTATYTDVKYNYSNKYYLVEYFEGYKPTGTIQTDIVDDTCYKLYNQDTFATTKATKNCDYPNSNTLYALFYNNPDVDTVQNITIYYEPLTADDLDKAYIKVTVGSEWYASNTGSIIEDDDNSSDVVISTPFEIDSSQTGVVSFDARTMYLASQYKCDNFTTNDVTFKEIKTNVEGTAAVYDEETRVLKIEVDTEVCPLEFISLGETITALELRVDFMYEVNLEKLGTESQDYTYSMQYKVVDAAGQPLANYDINGEKTDANGIYGKKTYSFSLDDLSLDATTSPEDNTRVASKVTFKDGLFATELSQTETITFGNKVCAFDVNWVQDNAFFLVRESDLTPFNFGIEFTESESNTVDYTIERVDASNPYDYECVIRVLDENVTGKIPVRISYEAYNPFSQVYETISASDLVFADVPSYSSSSLPKTITIPDFMIPTDVRAAATKICNITTEDLFNAGNTNSNKSFNRSITSSSLSYVGMTENYGSSYSDAAFYITNYIDLKKYVDDGTTTEDYENYLNALIEDGVDVNIQFRAEVPDLKITHRLTDGTELGTSLLSGNLDRVDYLNMALEGMRTKYTPTGVFELDFDNDNAPFKLEGTDALNSIVFDETRNKYILDARHEDYRSVNWHRTNVLWDKFAEYDYDLGYQPSEYNITFYWEEPYKTLRVYSVIDEDMSTATLRKTIKVPAYAHYNLKTSTSNFNYDIIYSNTVLEEDYLTYAKKLSTGEKFVSVLSDLVSNNVFVMPNEDYDLYFNYSEAYDIKVYDKYYDETGYCTKSTLRLTDTLKPNTEYSYSALDPIPEGYKLTSEATYSGTVESKNITVTFKYQLIPTYSVNVYDMFYDTSGNSVTLEDYPSTRIFETVTEGTTFNYAPLNPAPEGYSVKTYEGTPTGYVSTEISADDTFSSVINSYFAVWFYYYKNPSITVVDEYYNADGTLETSSTRLTKTITSGEEYSYNALTNEDYIVTSEENYSGTAGNSDITITFKYQKPITINVYDRYLAKDGTEESKTLRSTEKVLMGTEYSYDALNPIPDGYTLVSDATYSGTAGSTDIDLVFEYRAKVTVTVIDKYYSFKNELTNTVTRQTDTYTYNASYSYDALNPDGYIVTSDESYSGTLNGADVEVIFTYKALPGSYIITVHDAYYDADGTTLQRTEDRAPISVTEGDTYSVDALTVEHYTVFSDSNYSGTVETSNLDFTFKYKEDEKCTVVVNDVYQDTDGTEIKTDERETKTDYKGFSYSYDALNPIPEGYELVSDETYSGTATDDVTINFIYKKIPTFTVKVIDEYQESDSTLISSDERLSVTVYRGQTYDYSALNPIPEGYELIGADNYSGTVTTDLTIKFVYRKIPTFNITVIDRYEKEDGTLIEEVTRTTDSYLRDETYTYNALTPEEFEAQEPKTISGTATEDKIIIFTYKEIVHTITVVDEYLDIDGNVESSTTRLTEEHRHNYSYSFSALNPIPEGYKLVTTETKEGILTDDIEIKFIYKKLKSFNVTVYDEFYTVDGTLNRKDTRLTETKLEGDSYTYNALDPVPDGYKLTSEASYSGTITDDLEITFVYRDATSRFVTIKGYVTYSDGTPIANKYIEVHSTPRYATTDENGYYEINNVETGTHKFKIFNDSSMTSEIVTCDLEVTTPNNDTVQVTFKSPDVDVQTDTSQTDVLQIDAQLPIYKVTVIDEYYNETTLEKSETRCVDGYISGTAFEYKALDVDGYTVDVESYKGTVTENITLVFKYTKDKPPVEKFTLKVVDEYYDADYTLLDSVVRSSNEVEKGSSYYFDALNPSGYKDGDPAAYTGTVKEDTTLVFKYVKEAKEVKKYDVTVIDKYFDADGNLEKTETRLTDSFVEGSTYNYKALNPFGYKVTGAMMYEGIVTKDLVLEFTYQKGREKVEEEYTVTVIDKYIIYSDNTDNVVDGVNNVISVSRVVRCADDYKEGASYYYEALNPAGYRVVSDKVYSGTVNSDITLEFVYEMGIPTGDTPEVPNPDPIIPYSPEPKTGDDLPINVLPIMLVVAAISIYEYSRKRNRK